MLGEFENAIQEICEVIKEVFEDIVEGLGLIIDSLVDSSEHYKYKNLTRANLVTNYDTTKASQVLSRKPRVVIRKLM